MNVRLPPHDVVLTVIAETETSESQPMTVAVTWAGRRPSLVEIEKPTLYALVIGIADYKQQPLKLKHANKDARDFADALKRQEGGIYGKVNVERLVDEQATERAIRLKLDAIKRTMTTRDAALFFFSGHGVTLPDQSSYLINYDVDPDASAPVTLAKDRR
jgi:uncharacterized caspase-like protein